MVASKAGMGVTMNKEKGTKGRVREVCAPAEIGNASGRVRTRGREHRHEMWHATMGMVIKKTTAAL